MENPGDILIKNSQGGIPGREVMKQSLLIRIETKNNTQDVCGERSGVENKNPSIPIKWRKESERGGKRVREEREKSEEKSMERRRE